MRKAIVSLPVTFARDLEWGHYLLIFRNCRIIPDTKTNGYARMISRSIKAKIKYSFISHLQTKRLIEHYVLFILQLQEAGVNKRLPVINETHRRHHDRNMNVNKRSLYIN